MYIICSFQWIYLTWIPQEKAQKEKEKLNEEMLSC